MIVRCNVKVNVLNVNSTPSKDGTKTYHKVSVFDSSSGESGMLSCSDEVFKLWQDKTIKLMDEVVLCCEYNDNYDSFRAVSVLPAEKADKQ